MLTATSTVKPTRPIFLVPVSDDIISSPVIGRDINAIKIVYLS
jgi:hypothetical protein